MHTYKNFSNYDQRKQFVFKYVTEVLAKNTLAPPVLVEISDSSPFSLKKEPKNDAKKSTVKRVIKVDGDM